ncbi:MAG: hypothetical protein HUU25_15170 [Candidatus Sumerlaeia bacterium]|nr:hypothetical protein [Candidatus Sumerlaeia bacterium]
MSQAPWAETLGVDAVVSGWLASGAVRRCLAAERLIGDAGGPWAGAARALGGRVPHHAHSDYLEITVGTGGVGLGLFVWLVVDSLRSGWRGTRRGEPGWRGVKAASLAGLVCLGALAAVSFPLHRPVHLAIFWICVGLCRRP